MSKDCDMKQCWFGPEIEKKVQIHCEAKIRKKGAIFKEALATKTKINI